MKSENYNIQEGCREGEEKNERYISGEETKLSLMYRRRISRLVDFFFYWQRGRRISLSDGTREVVFVVRFIILWGSFSVSRCVSSQENLSACMRFESSWLYSRHSIRSLDFIVFLAVQRPLRFIFQVFVALDDASFNHRNSEVDLMGYIPRKTIL